MGTHLQSSRFLAFPRLALVLVPLGFALAACSTPVVGTWRSDNKLPNGLRNEMTVDSDLVGTATIYATPEGATTTWSTFQFGATGTEASDGASWKFKMACQGATCSNDDFKMTCEVIDEGTDEPIKMNCKGDAKWDKYPFDWEEVDN